MLQVEHMGRATPVEVGPTVSTCHGSCLPLHALEFLQDLPPELKSSKRNLSRSRRSKEEAVAYPGAYLTSFHAGSSISEQQYLTRNERNLD